MVPFFYGQPCMCVCYNSYVLVAELLILCDSGYCPRSWPRLDIWWLHLPCKK